VQKKGNKFKKKQNANKKHRVCFHCGNKGHYIKECRFKNFNKKGGSFKVNMVEKDEVKELVDMVSNIQIGMITELNMTTNVVKTSDWWLDSGATIHVCNNKAWFKTYEELKKPEEVLMGNHNSAKVLGKGIIELYFTSGQKMSLLNVFHVPEIRKNLVSASLLSKKGFKIVLESDKVIVTKSGKFVGKGYSCDDIFKFSINEINVISAYMVESTLLLWHARLGHLNYRYLKYMCKHGYISYQHNNKNKCEVCIQAKMTNKPFPKVERNSQLLKLVHSDICEINGMLTRGGKRYFITFIDDYSHFTYVYLLRTKDEAFGKFKEFKKMVENQKERQIKVLRSDRGGEYFSKEFSTFCEENEIIQQMTAPCTPQHNGLAERKNRTLVDMVNAMLFEC
jgi:hypothetical protein